MDCSKLNKNQLHILFVGNPGSGKSTLLNSLMGKVAFKSGVSYGSGLTSYLQEEKYNGISYMDTPGLSDIQKREQAALEIGRALKKNGIYKLVFVCKLDAGRVRPDDSVTIKLVLDAIDDEYFPYAIILNQLSERVINDFRNKPETLNEVITCLNEGHRPTIQVHYYPEIKSLTDANNVLITPEPDFVQFINNMLGREIKAELVKEINTKNYEEEYKYLAAEIEKVQRDSVEREKKLQEQITYMEQTDMLSNIFDAFTTGLWIMDTILRLALRK